MATHHLLAVPVLVLILATCKEKKPDTSENTTTGATLSAPGGAPARESTPPLARDRPQSPSPPPGNFTPALGDGQIVHVLRVASAAEIAQANLVRQLTTATRVKTFAESLTQERRDLDARLLDLAAKDKLLLMESSTGTALKRDSDRAMEELRTTSVKDAERAYMNIEVNDLQALLDTIDTKLLPSAYDDDVRELVLDVRSRTVMDLAEAREVQSDVLKNY